MCCPVVGGREVLGLGCARPSGHGVHRGDVPVLVVEGSLEVVVEFWEWPVRAGKGMSWVGGGRCGVREAKVVGDGRGEG